MNGSSLNGNNNNNHNNIPWLLQVDYLQTQIKNKYAMYNENTLYKFL